MLKPERLHGHLQTLADRDLKSPHEFGFQLVHVEIAGVNNEIAITSHWF